MSDASKQFQISGGTLLTEFKNIFFFIRKRRTVAFAYGFVFVFIVCSVFMAFNPSFSNSSSTSSSYHWFSGIFSNSENTPQSNDGSSHFSSSLYSYFFPNSTSPESVSPLPSPDRNPDGTLGKSHVKNEVTSPAPTVSERVGNFSHSGVEKQSNTMKPETSTSPNSTRNTSPAPAPAMSDKVANLSNSGVQIQSNFTKPETSASPNSTRKVDIVNKNTTTVSKPPPVGSVGNTNTPLKSNHTPSFLKKETNNRTSSKIEALSNCNIFDGNWVQDESYPLYKPNSCSLIDEQFNCVLNGRPDKDYMKLKWQPKQCTLPRFNAKHMLQFLKGKRLVYVGDSLNRNMWESMICILKTVVTNQNNVYEVSGRHHFKGEASYSFIFKDYNFTVEFFVSPFLVREWELSRKDGDGLKKETLRLDLIGQTADSYKGADIIVFNTGHWWTHDKTSKGEDYYQEGSHVYHELNVLEAFRKALTTWARWVDTNIDSSKTHVFFRGYSASHFSGGQWNSGGACDSETEPIKNETYLTPYPSKMNVLEKVIRGMKTQVSYLNITRITDFRKDGHPSIYRKQHESAKEQKSGLKYQDCSHWCLPGVPDTWNELLYAQLLVKDYERQHKDTTR